MSWNIAKPGDQINGPVAVTGNLNVDSNTLFVDSANNRVGVLTASPTVPLDVVGDAKISGNLTVDTNTLVVDAANNRLGIGTATPAYPLSVNGRISYIGAIGEGADTTLSSSSTGLLHGNSSYWTEHRFYASGNEQHRIAQSGVFTWYDGAGGTRMTLNATGLGVGIAPVTSKVHVAFGDSGTAGLREANSLKIENTNTTANNLTGLFLSQAGDAGCGIAAIATSRTGGSRTSDLALYSYAQATSANPIERLRIDSSGNVGIGTTTPSAAIHSAKAAAANPTGGSAAGAGLYVSNVNPLYGMMFGVNGGGVGWIQQQRSDATNTQYDLSLQPLGGKVGIGTVSPNNTVEVSSSGASNTRVTITNTANAAFGAGFYLRTLNGASLVSNATLLTDNAGNFQIYNGTSTESLKLTLDASGRLGIGVTPAAILHVEGSAAQARFSVASATDARHEYYRNSVREAYIGWDANDFAIFATQANGVLRFGSGNTERLRIKSTGQVNFVGLASDPAGAAPGDVYYNTTTNKLKCYNGTTWNDLF